LATIWRCAYDCFAAPNLDYRLTPLGRFLLFNSRAAMFILKVKAVSAIEAPDHDHRSM
jgi:hypothetical protein